MAHVELAQVSESVPVPDGYYSPKRRPCIELVEFTPRLMYGGTVMKTHFGPCRKTDCENASLTDIRNEKVCTYHAGQADV